MNIQYIHPADQLVMFMQRIYDKGLTTMSGGNLSIRDTQGNIWITPAGIDKGTLTRKDIICVRPDGSCEGPHKPSSELPFHESVYRMRPDLNAVLPTYFNALLQARRSEAHVVYNEELYAAIDTGAFYEKLTQLRSELGQTPQQAAQ